MNIDEVLRISAFAIGDQGGNPAGVALLDALPEANEMQRIAAEVGYSETAFAAPTASENTQWRVRYFAPEIEVPFCGHATIALGAALGSRFGEQTYSLQLNAATITVESLEVDGRHGATLVSPPASVSKLDADALARISEIFAISLDDVAPGTRPVVANAGAPILIYRLASAERLKAFGAEMAYDFDTARRELNATGLVGAYFAFREADDEYRSRLAFPTGGVREDPATGAAAAALGGLLREEGALPQNGRFAITQGEQMGVPSRLTVDASAPIGAGVAVSGACRWIA